MEIDKVRRKNDGEWNENGNGIKCGFYNPFSAIQVSLFVFKLLQATPNSETKRRKEMERSSENKYNFLTDFHWCFSPALDMQWSALHLCTTHSTNHLKINFKHEI